MIRLVGLIESDAMLSASPSALQGAVVGADEVAVLCLGLDFEVGVVRAKLAAYLLFA